jgi:tRNA(adenine34) deaminase
MDAVTPPQAPADAELDARDRHYMRRALDCAREAQARFGEVPVGALIVVADAIVAEGGNRCITDHDPTAHAEIVALRTAGRQLGNYRLPGATLYVTLEPCVMCAGAMIHARVERVVYAAADPKTGAAGSVFDTLISERHNHRVAVRGGVMAEEAGELLRGFFSARRLAAARR